MYVCKIEIDFGRQSFRVFRRPFLQQDKPMAPPPRSPCTDKLRKAYFDQTLPILDKNRTSSQKRPSQLDIFQTLGDTHNENPETDLAAGGILTSIHVPSRPDNNFQKVFNAMLPEDIVEQRRKNCTCHKRKHKDVDMNKIMFDLVKSISKNNESKDEDDRGAKTDAPVPRESFFKGKPSSHLLRKNSRCFNFWIGSEYKYDVYENKVLLKFVLIGQPPENRKQMYIDIHVPGGVKENRAKVKLEKIGQQNEIGKEFAIEMVSFLRTLEEEVHVTLNIRGGFLRKGKCIDEWQFPLNDCHCVHPRSFWKNINC